MVVMQENSSPTQPALLANSAAKDGNAIRPFRINIPEAMLVDLRRRLAEDTVTRQGNCHR